MAIAAERVEHVLSTVAVSHQKYTLLIKRNCNECEAKEL